MALRSSLAKLFSSEQKKSGQPTTSDTVATAPPIASSSSSHKAAYGLRVLKEPVTQEGQLITEYTKRVQYAKVITNFAESSIVFVHGLTGNRESTWTCNKTLWPETLLPTKLPGARILTFGFDADVVNFWSPAGQNRIGHHAQSLAESLANQRDVTETSTRPILFVAHSLGGLICENALLKSKNSAEAYLQAILAHTRGICFLGTPHCGSSLASWASLCGNFTNLLRRTNKNILNVLNPNSEVLANIQEEFHTMLRARADRGEKPIRLMCFFEELPVTGVGLVVPQHSAILPAYGSKSIHANHMDMTKFESVEDPGFMDVSTTLWRWVRDLAKQTNVTSVVSETPQSQSEITQSQSGLLEIEGGRAPGENAWRSVNTFSGHNNTGGGRVFQGSIDAQGDVIIG